MQMKSLSLSLVYWEGQSEALLSAEERDEALVGLKLGRTNKATAGTK